jgi:hypothetical protein
VIDRRAVEIYDAELSPQEFDRRLARMRESGAESAEVEGLIAWFRRQYPTPRERLAYVRRKAVEWGRGRR